MKRFIIAILVASFGLVTTAQGQLIGNISADLTLLEDSQHIMTGCVIVENGVTLTIEKGVKICADNGASLTIEPGGVLNIEGTESQPVVFTSNKAPHLRSPGDWVGIRIMGKSIYNNGLISLSTCTVEQAGGNQPNDNSGRIAHLKIHYAGGESSDLFNNALSLAAVGSNTVLEHIEVAYAAENGIGFIGGNAPMSEVFLLNNRRNDLFFSDGNQSNVELVLAIRNDMDAHFAHLTGSNGIYLQNNNNDATSYAGTPGTQPFLNHISLLGPAFCEDPTSGNFFHGIQFDKNAGGIVENSVIAGFKKYGLYINEEQSAAKTTTGELKVEYTSFIDNILGDYEYNDIAFNWFGNGCGSFMTDWMDGSVGSCFQDANQFGSFVLGYDMSFCGDFCDNEFMQNFVLNLLISEIEAPSINSVIDFRGAVEENVRFTWINPCPESVSNCVVKSSKNINLLDIYPNPAKESTILGFESMQIQTVKVSVIEIITGRVLYQSQIKVTEGEQSIKIPTQSLKEGLYHIQIQSENEVWYGKLNVQ